MSITVGDFNRDGRLDLAFVNMGSGDLSVLLNGGSRTFLPAVSYALGYKPSVVTSLDLNGDGILDLATGEYSPWSGLKILLGRSDGTFQTAVNQGDEPYCRSIKGGDFNGDGKIDLVTVREAGILGVRLNPGTDSFPIVGEYTVASRAYSMETADFNGDARLDLVVVDFQANTVVLLVGNGDGTFERKEVDPGGMAPIFVTVGDLNGDEKVDLILGGIEQGWVKVLLGRGDATFQAGINVLTGAYPVAITVADFDRNNILDLAVINPSHEILSILAGRGNGTFEEPINNSTGGKPTSLAAADFDGDGNCDVAMSNDLSNGPYEPGTISILWGKADGVLDAPLSVDVGLDPTSLIAQDLNHDGRPDLIMTEWSGMHLLVALGAENEKFEFHTNYAVGLKMTAPGILADFNADGNLDLMVPAWNFPNSPDFYTVLGFLGAADGSFLKSGREGASLSSYGSSLASGDFNGDAKLDLAVTLQWKNAVEISLGNGDGSFLPAVNYAFGVFPGDMATGDFNGDARLDLAVTHDHGISILLGRGDGTLGPDIPLTTNGPAFLAAADLDNDGTADLVAAFHNSRNISTWLSRDGLFQPQLDYVVGWSRSFPVIADVNGDARPDIAVPTADGVAILSGNGDGRFGSCSKLSVGANPSSLVIADFSNDGMPDIGVLSGSVRKRLSILLNRCEAPAPRLTMQRSEYAVTLSWPVASRDFVLESTTDLDPPRWQTFPETPITNIDSLEVTVPFEHSGRYFRLHRILPERLQSAKTAAFPTRIPDQQKKRYPL